MSLIEFREPVDDDRLTLPIIHQYFAKTYLADGDSVDPDTFDLDTMVEKYTLIFQAPATHGRLAIGSCDFTDVNQDLSARLHFIMYPKCLKPFLDEKVYLDALLDRFIALKVKKFVIITEDFNKLAQRVAVRIGFKRVGTLKNEVYYNGEPRDVHFYELTRKDLAKALALHFIAEESEDKPPPKPIVAKVPRPRKERKNHVKQQSQQKRPKSVKTHEPVFPIRAVDER